MRDVTLSRRGVLGVAAGALVADAARAEPPKTAAPNTPAPEAGVGETWADPVLPAVTHRIVEANGIRIHVAEQGAGPLVILCHGFPECWYSWRHQLPALAQAGFRAVAFDLRGYGLSEAPADIEKYTLLHYIGDVVGLLDVLGAKQAVIAGHDIGAAIAWQAALLRPDRFKGVIALSPPFRPRAFGATAQPPTTLMPQNKDAVFYQIFFQAPEAEAALARNTRRVFRAQLYSLSADGQRAGAGGFAGGMVPRKGAPLTDPASLPTWVTEADVDVYVAAFARGFRGALNWWRNVDRSWELMAAFDGAQVTVPALYIAGDRDFVVGVFKQSVAEQSKFVPNLRSIVLPDCGHWTQQERSSEVSAAMIDFLRQV